MTLNRLKLWLQIKSTWQKHVTYLLDRLTYKVCYIAAKGLKQNMESVAWEVKMATSQLCVCVLVVSTQQYQCNEMDVLSAANDDNIEVHWQWKILHFCVASNNMHKMCVISHFCDLLLAQGYSGPSCCCSLKILMTASLSSPAV
jgi:hypothetical protein